MDPQKQQTNDPVSIHCISIVAEGRVILSLGRSTLTGDAARKVLSVLFGDVKGLGEGGEGDLSSTSDELHILQVSRADVEKWDITSSEKGSILRPPCDIHRDTASVFDAISVRPDHLLDPVLKLDTALAAQAHSLFALLRIFPSGVPAT
ncbi:hypothetical protein EDB84DRAFT_1438045 [Lactarius hengduanensis]|nr:hypothetical protein EDB84DRAFT_1438045 [Lactarius hengduanensis]